MDGYIKNKTGMWSHALKRNIGPGQEVSLDELYEEYGKKHDIEEGLPFVKWLRSIKLSDKQVWEIVYNEEETKSQKANKTKAVKEKEADDSQETSIVAPLVKKGVEIEDVINWSVRQAREKLPKFTDLKTLKYSLVQANQLANKDTLCRMLRKKIGELEMSRR